MEAVAIFGSFFIFFMVGYSVGQDTYQETIDKFKQPVCVERKVGVELIKKCYVLQEKK